MLCRKVDQVVSLTHDSLKFRNHSFSNRFSHRCFALLADNLEEVNVPIMKNCKASVDITGNEICAGEKDGGHDACQGK